MGKHLGYTLLKWVAINIGKQAARTRFCTVRATIATLLNVGLRRYGKAFLSVSSRLVAAAIPAKIFVDCLQRQWRTSSASCK